MRAGSEANVLAQLQCCSRFNGSQQKQPWCVESNSTLMAVPIIIKSALPTVAALAVSMTIMLAKSALCHCALIIVWGTSPFTLRVEKKPLSSASSVKSSLKLAREAACSDW